MKGDEGWTDRCPGRLSDASPAGSDPCSAGQATGHRALFDAAESRVTSADWKRLLAKEVDGRTAEDLLVDDGRNRKLIAGKKRKINGQDARVERSMGLA